MQLNGPVGRKGCAKARESARQLYQLIAERKDEKEECEAQFWGDWLMFDLANDPYFKAEQTRELAHETN